MTSESEVRSDQPDEYRRHATRVVDKPARLVLIAQTMRVPALACSLLLLLSHSAAAMVGGAPAADPALARHLVMIVGPRGLCTATAIARDLILTAAHCVAPGADYKLFDTDASGRPRFSDVARILRHPQFSMDNYKNARVTADLALVKLAKPLPAQVVPAMLAAPARPVAAGDRLTIAGYGVAAPGDGTSSGRARRADLVVTGRPGSLQIRLVDPATGGERAGLGSCEGDSGAPAFDFAASRPVVIGVVSWATGPKQSAGCGGLTGLTPLAGHRDWIARTARELGTPLP
jgi:secreted trypsin-like serine protease